MHPTFTQVPKIKKQIPPKPHFVPAGEDFTKSAKPTLAPYEAAALEHARPPDPPPMTKRS